jgi:hypothetical protein
VGLILDSSVVIAAERQGETAERLIERIIHTTGDQEAALSAVGLTNSSTAFIVRKLPPSAFAVSPS